MDSYMMINGQRVELAEEQADKLLRVAEAMGAVTTTTVQEPEPKSPFARVEVGEPYFLISGEGKVCTNSERGVHFDGNCYAVANYCADKDLLQQRAWHEELSRQLWRYSEEHGGDAEWGLRTTHYYICQRGLGRELRVAFNDDYKGCGTVYFRSKETAEAAIRDIVEPFIEAHPDFKR